MLKLFLNIQANFQKYKFILFPLITVFFSGILFYFSPKFIPDYFDIANYSKIYELFNLIIGSLVSIIGIYVTVSLVAYEFFKQKSGIDFHKSFLLNSISAYFISFTVITIIFIFFSSVLISHTNPTNKEISIIYFDIFLFSLTIALLIPVSFNLFSSLRPEKLAFEEIDKIDRKSIHINSVNVDIENVAELYENDNLNKTENIVIALIAVSDSIKAQVIIQKATKKLAQLLIEEDKKEAKELIAKRLIDFHISIIDFSLTQPNKSNMLRNIWLAINNMYSMLIRRKESAVHFKKYREIFIERYINRLFENNKEEVIIYGIETIKNIIENQVIFNTADENEIIELYHLRKDVEKDFVYPNDYSDEKLKISEHWSEITLEMSYCFTYIINQSIQYNKPNIINKCYEEINSLNFKLHLERVGKYKEGFFYLQYSSIISDYTYTAFDKNIFQEGSDAKHLLPSLFFTLIEEEHLAARTVLQKYCYLLINLQKINKLDRWFLGGLTIGNLITLEGDLGQIARRCSYNYYKNDLVQNCLQDIIETYSILKKYYEKYPKNDFHLYISLRERLVTILDILLKEKNEKKKLIKKLKRIIKSFKKEDDYI